MANLSLEERVAAVETDVARLKERLATQTPTGTAPWWKGIVGVFRNDPMFDEAMRLGREYRESLRPEGDDSGSAT